MAPTTTAPAAPVASAESVTEHRNWLQTIGHDIEVGVIDIKTFVSELPKILAAWNKLAPQVKTVALQLFHDVLKIVADATQAAADAKALNVPGTITLSTETWAAIQELVADAKAGDVEILASLKLLGVTI